MTYKSASDKTSYLERTASHATKESKRGIIKAVPVWAEEAEQYYNSMKERFSSLIRQNDHILKQITNLKLRLLSGLSHKEQLITANLIRHLGQQSQALQQELGQYRPMVRAIGSESWARIFYICASELLDQETFSKITAEAREFLDRPEHEFEKGRSELSDQKQQSLKQREKRHNRTLVAEAQKTGALVWSDEKGIRTEYGDFGRKVGPQAIRNKVSRILKRNSPS
jgi:hypothetical protein